MFPHQLGRRVDWCPGGSGLDARVGQPPVHTEHAKEHHRRHDTQPAG